MTDTAPPDDTVLPMQGSIRFLSPSKRLGRAGLFPDSIEWLNPPLPEVRIVPRKVSEKDEAKEAAEDEPKKSEDDDTPEKEDDDSAEKEEASDDTATPAFARIYRFDLRKGIWQNGDNEKLDGRLDKKTRKELTGKLTKLAHKFNAEFGKIVTAHQMPDALRMDYGGLVAVPPPGRARGFSVARKWRGASQAWLSDQLSELERLEAWRKDVRTGPALLQQRLAELLAPLNRPAPIRLSVDPGSTRTKLTCDLIMPPAALHFGLRPKLSGQSLEFSVKEQWQPARVCAAVGLSQAVALAHAVRLVLPTPETRLSVRLSVVSENRHAPAPHPVLDLTVGEAGWLRGLDAVARLSVFQLVEKMPPGLTLLDHDGVFQNRKTPLT